MHQTMDMAHLVAHPVMAMAHPVMAHPVAHLVMVMAHQRMDMALLVHLHMAHPVAMAHPVMAHLVAMAHLVKVTAHLEATLTLPESKAIQAIFLFNKNFYLALK